MHTLTTEPAHIHTPDRAPTRVPAQGFGTNLRVETRKLLDTRGGLAVLGLTIAACLFAVIWLLSHSEYAVTYHRYSTGAANIVAFFIPVVTLLAMTSEWTQRTALSTFTLSPRRGRVIGAKFVAAVTVSCATLVTVLVLAAGATMLGGSIRGHASWGHAASDIRTYFVIMLLQVVMAAAFAALAGQTAVALVAYFVAPTAWGAVAQNVFGTSARWFDIFESYGRLSSDHPFDQLAKTLVAATVWVVIPAALGIWRSLRREIK